MDKIISVADLNKIIRAVDFATRAHQDQRRKDAKQRPYIGHPTEVMTMLSNAGITDPDTLCAAVLHDTIEDVGVTYEQLVEKFGVNVANIVRECSDDKSLPKEVRKQEQIRHAAHASNSAKMIKCADKLSNLSDLDRCPPPKWSKEEIDGYFIWSYHVWQVAKGFAADVDKQLFDLFAKRGIIYMKEEALAAALDKYYKDIKKSG